MKKRKQVSLPHARRTLKVKKINSIETKKSILQSGDWKLNRERTANEDISQEQRTIAKSTEKEETILSLEFSIILSLDEIVPELTLFDV